LDGASGDFAAFTFPRYREMLDRPGEPRLAVGAWLDGKPAGLALALWEPDSPQVRLLSLMVDADARRRSIGTQLLQRCEELAAATGSPRVATYFSSILPCADAFHATLAAAGWSAPKPLELRCACQAGALGDAIAAWPAMRARLAMEGGVAFKPWGERTPAEEGEVADLAAAEDCPSGLTPSRWHDDMEAEHSLLMLQSGRVVGWILARREPSADPDPLAPPTLFVLAAYIRRELWRSGLLVLSYHFIVRQHAERFGDAAEVRFSTSHDYPGMMALTRRRFAPAALWVDEWLYAHKLLR